MPRPKIISYSDAEMANRASWKHPLGPWQKAPAEYGGRWYQVTAWTVETGPDGTTVRMPWQIERDQAPAAPPPPSAFIEVFGPRPTLEEFKDHPNPSLAFRAASQKWEHDLMWFRRGGHPDEYSAAEIEAAQADYRRPEWGMGEARFYEGRYGWMARFPKSKLPRSFEAPAWAVIRRPQNIIAAYQIDALTDGFRPGKVRHWLVPAELWDSVPG